MKKKATTKPYKLNNYQIILSTWGFIVLIGFLLSIPFFSNLVIFALIWIIVAIVGFGTQFKLGGFKGWKTISIQVLWIVVFAYGYYWNYLEYFGIERLHGNGFGEWPIAVAVAMLIIAIIYRFNLSYILLFALYFAFGLIVNSISNFNAALAVSGIGFAALCFLDAGLEGTKIRALALPKFRHKK